MNEIAFATLALQEVNRLGSLVPKLLEREQWKGDERLRYCDVREFVRNNLGSVLGDAGRKLLDTIEFECLAIDGELNPHYHNNSDSVVIALNSNFAPEDFEAQLGIGHSVITHPLARSETILIHRRMIHGFRRKNKMSHPLLLLVASYPPIAEDDVHFVDL